MPEVQKDTNPVSRFKKLIGKVASSSMVNPIKSISGKRKAYQLNKEVSKLDSREEQLKQRTIEGNDVVKEKKIAALREIYSYLEKMGVDPTDLESIAAFREKLMEQDPDLAEIFFNAFDQLSSGLDVEETQIGQTLPTDLMEANTTNLQNGIMR